jgi:hypothetical protein
MAFFTEIVTALDALRGVLGEEAEAVDVPAAVNNLADDALVGLIEQASVLVRAGESVRIAATGAVAARSTREAAHGGLAQKRGHRSAVSLIQDLTGTTRADAAKQVRLGEALAAGSADASVPDGADATTPCPAPRPWHAVLGDALMTGVLTSAQHDAIYRGLGEPPTTCCANGTAAADADAGAEVVAAWESAAGQLVDEAGVRTVEELAAAARTIRDLLDPAGAERRFDERFQGRAFRTWLDRDGVRRGSFIFDDEGGAWVQTILETALRPRRGGPRFVDPAEKARADELINDPRSNDQLAYDLILDVLRAGALADAETVFGARQPGIRIVTTHAAHQDALGGHPAVALLEDTDTALPGWLLATHTCGIGTRTVIHDDTGNPLDVGREARLYTPKQRVALAIRDGGCRIPGCDRPASYCEAHHIDEFVKHEGRTDIDRGILLCRFHHMNLHHQRWRITRNGKDEFTLHRPAQPPSPLPTRLARRYAFGDLHFGDLQPPPLRFHPTS